VRFPDANVTPRWIRLKNSQIFWDESERPSKGRFKSAGIANRRGETKAPSKEGPENSSQGADFQSAARLSRPKFYRRTLSKPRRTSMRIPLFFDDALGQFRPIAPQSFLQSGGDDDGRGFQAGFDVLVVALVDLSRFREFRLRQMILEAEAFQILTKHNFSRKNSVQRINRLVILKYLAVSMLENIRAFSRDLMVFLPFRPQKRPALQSVRPSIRCTEGIEE
jgi:hypothetical protein